MSESGAVDGSATWVRTAVAAGGTFALLAALYWKTSAVGADTADQHRQSGGRGRDSAIHGGQGSARSSSGNSGGGQGANSSRAATPSEREASALRSVTPVMSFRVSSSAAGQRGETPTSSMRQVSPAASFRGRASAGRSTAASPVPPARNVHFQQSHAAADAAGAADSAATWSSEESHSSDRFFAAGLPSQLEWGDPVLGIFLQYPTHHMLQNAEVRAAPCVRLPFWLRALPTDGNAGDLGAREMTIRIEQTGPLPDDRGGLGDPARSGIAHVAGIRGFAPGASGSPARTLPARNFSTVDFQRAMSPGKPTASSGGSGSASRFASSFDDAGAAADHGSDNDVAVRTIEEHIDAYRGYLNDFTDVAVEPPPAHAKNVQADTDTVVIRIRSAPQRQMALLDDAAPVNHVDYHLLVFRSTTGADPSEAGKRKAAAYPSKKPNKTTSYGAVFIAAHPRIPHLFVNVTIPHLKHHPIAAKGHPHRSLSDILSYIAFAAPLPTPSYNLLAEPKCGTGFRVPLCFGRHSSRAVLGATAAGASLDVGPYTELHSDGDEDQELNFADLWGRVERQRKRALRSGLRSQMSTASTAAAGRVAPSASQFRGGTSTAGGSEMSSSAAPHTRPRLDGHHPRRTTLQPREGAAYGHAHASLKGRVPTRYAMLCADDCAVIASLEPFAPGGEKALPMVTRECIHRLSHNLQLAPPLRCVVDGEDGTSPPQQPPQGAAVKPMVLRARVRQYAITRLGDAAWWPAALRSFLRPYEVTGDNINARNNQPESIPSPPPNTRGKNPTQRVTITTAGTMDRLRVVVRDDAGSSSSPVGTCLSPEGRASQQSADANAQTLNRLDCVDDRAPRRHEACRFALYCFAVPMSANPSAASFCSLAFLASRSVSQKPFARFYKECQDTMSLDNFRGQTPTLHYIGNRHNIRLQLPRHWHALEPALADPALVLYRAELPPGRVNPPFLTQSHASGPEDPTTPLPASATPPPPSEADRGQRREDADWDFAGPQAVPGSGSASPLGAPHSGGLCDGLLLREINAHPLHPRPPQHEDETAAGIGGGGGGGVAEAGGDEAAEHHHPKPQQPSPAAGWWRNLLPVITLRTTAAPSKSALLEQFPPHDVTARFRAKSMPMPPLPQPPSAAFVGNAPSYFDLWCRWVEAMAADAASSTSGFDPTQSPMGSAPEEDVSVRSEPIKCGGMRGVLITVEQSVVIETTTPAMMSATMAPTTPQSGPSAAGGLPAGPLAGTQSSASVAAAGMGPVTSSSSSPNHHPRAPPVSGGAPIRQDTLGGLSSVSSGLFHSCEGPPLSLPPQGAAAASSAPAAAASSAPDRSPLGHPHPSPPQAALEVVRRLRFSSFAAAPGPSFNACSPPSLMTLADHVRHLDVALLAHLQAWRWAATEGALTTSGVGVSSSAAVDASGTTAQGQSRSAATSAPPTPLQRPMRITATGHGPLSIGPQRHMAREVRVIVALLPPLWHQDSQQHTDPSVGSGQTPHAADDTAGDCEANADVERASQIWQTQALPAELAAPAREALVGMLRTLELLSPK